MPSSLSTSRDPVTRCRPLLGTFVEISAVEADSDTIRRAFGIVAHVHAHMSFHEAGSDLARLRAAAPGEVVEVDHETASVLRIAVSLHEATDGLFDVAVGRALVRGGFLPREGIDRLRDFPGTTADIEVVDDRHVRCKRRVLIDLGGIAKGYAVDRALEQLQALGIPAGSVNAGGDLRVFGDREWQIQLRDADDLVRHVLSVRDGAMASSANLHNRRQVGGAFYTPHIGREGKPTFLDHRVTVLAEKCVMADAMTKVAMVAPDLADDILAAHGGYVLRDSMLVEAA